MSKARKSHRVTMMDKSHSLITSVVSGKPARLPEPPDIFGKPDYYGDDPLDPEWIAPHMRTFHIRCGVCNKFTYCKCAVHGVCPKCVLDRPEFALTISYGRSRSKNYPAARKLSRKIPYHTEDGDKHIISFAALSEYCEYRETAEKLTRIIYNWVSFRAVLNGRDITAYHITCICAEINRMRDHQKAVDIGFVGNMAVFTYDRPVTKGEIAAASYRQLP